jgi:hypothetical protein
MASADSTIRSPKRKRDAPLKAASPSRLSTNLVIASPPGNEASSRSPRSAVAYHIQRLHLDGDKISRLDLGCSSHIPNLINDRGSVRKRVRTLEGDRAEIPETPLASRIHVDLDHKGEILETQKAESGTPGPAGQVMITAQEPTNEFSMQDDEIIAVSRGFGAQSRSSAPKPSRAHPWNYPFDPKSRSRRRISTPPLSIRAGKAASEFDVPVVDPDRVALTWHEDEITGHDPSDPDDDGEGINGIGFKPTPMQANARAERRRQQMAEYRSREMKEARAKRSERRSGGRNGIVESREALVRKVRFSEAGANVIITT